MPPGCLSELLGSVPCLRNGREREERGRGSMGRERESCREKRGGE